MTDATQTPSGTEYDDSYHTCAETYAELRIYTGELAPQGVVEALKIKPTMLLVAGENGARVNGWFLSTRGQVTSRDVRRHVDWLLEQLLPQEAALHRLQVEPHYWMDVFCYWRSTQRHGGPMLNPKQMQVLAELKLAIGFDCF